MSRTPLYSWTHFWMQELEQLYFLPAVPSTERPTRYPLPNRAQNYRLTPTEKRSYFWSEHWAGTVSHTACAPPASATSTQPVPMLLEKSANSTVAKPTSFPW